MDLQLQKEKVENLLHVLEPPSKEELWKELKRRADDVDILDHLAKADEVIVCGSRALGIQRPNSDIDVIVVHSERFMPKILSETIDFMPFKKDDLERKTHKLPELINSAVTYGVWLKGDEDREKYLSPITEEYLRTKKRLIWDRAVKEYTADPKESSTTQRITTELEFVISHLMGLDWLLHERCAPSRTILKWEAVLTDFEFISRVQKFMGSPFMNLLFDIVPQVPKRYTMRGATKLMFKEEWTKDLVEAQLLHPQV